MQAGPQLVKLSQVRVAGKNVRSEFNKEELDELAASIRENGILQPLVCRQTKNGLEVVAGERRLRAAKIAGLKEVPIVVREIHDDDLIHIRLIENLQRADLPIEDQFQALSTLRGKGVGVQKISKITGVNTTKINRILGLEDILREFVKLGRRHHIRLLRETTLLMRGFAELESFIVEKPRQTSCNRAKTNK